MSIFQGLLHNFSPKKEWIGGIGKTLPIEISLLSEEVLGAIDYVRPSGARKINTFCKSESH